MTTENDADRKGFADGAAHAREAVAQEPVAVPEGALTERIAKLLWERFAPEHHVEWEGETHKAEYRSVADDVLSMLRAYVTVAPTGWRLVPETATDEMIEAAWDSDAADYVGEHKRIHCLADAWKEMLTAAPASPPADHSEDILDMVKAPPAESGEVNCQKCAGNGEIVADWGRYLEAKPGDVGDEAVAECPECSGTGKVDAAPQPGGAVKQRVLERISVFASYSPEEGESWESWYHSAFDLLASEVAALEPSPSQWNAGAEATKTRARPLDLAAMLKHAWIAGNAGTAWEDYDPTELLVYRRLAAALGITITSGEG